MRYMTVPNVVFTALNGKSYSVKDMREIPAQTIRKTIEYKGITTLDEVASRQEIYGDQGEDQAYKIFEENMVDIFDAKFDMNKIKRLRIPV